MVRRLLCLGMVLAAVGLTAVPVAADAAGQSAYQQVLRAYDSQGTVPACRFSSVELSDALTGIDTYGAQYFADFTQAIQTALSTRAAGACTTVAAVAPQRAPGGVAEPPAHFGSVTAATSAGIPAPLAVMAALALAAALLGAGTAVVRVRTRR